MTAFENTASTSGSFHSLSDLTVGTDDGQRLKHQISLKSLHLNVCAYPADATNILRFIVFQYFDDSFPTTANILQSTSSTNSWLSPYNFDNAKAFRILYDSSKMLNGVAKPGIVFNKYVKLTKARKNVEYSGTTSNGLNKVYLLVVSDSTAVSHPTFKGIATLTYTDS